MFCPHTVDGLDNTNQMKRVLAKVSKLVTIASDLFEGENSANVNRWNSQLMMLKSLLKVCNSEQLNYNGKLNTYKITT